MSLSSNSNENAKQRYQQALEMIVRAEELLSSASGELCNLIGAVAEWELVGDEYERVRDLRRLVSYSSARDNVRLDDL